MHTIGKIITALMFSVPVGQLGSGEVLNVTSPAYVRPEASRTNSVGKLVKAGNIPIKYSSPNINIDGLTGHVDLGEMVILTAEYNQDELPDNLVSMSFQWTILDEGKQKKVFMSDNGKQIAFAVGMKSRTIQVILDTNCLFETKQTVQINGPDGKPTDQEVIVDASNLSPTPIFGEIIVGGDVPQPNPPVPPNPLPVPPAPAPIFPDGQFGLSKFAYDAFMADTNLTGIIKSQMASKLADGLEGIASQATSTNTDLATLLANTKTANDAAFATVPGLDITKTTALKAAIKAKIQDLYKNNKINTPSDLAIAWRELALGLRSVK